MKLAGGCFVNNWNMVRFNPTKQKTVIFKFQYTPTYPEVWIVEIYLASNNKQYQAIAHSQQFALCFILRWRRYFQSDNLLISVV